MAPFEVYFAETDGNLPIKVKIYGTKERKDIEFQLKHDMTVGDFKRYLLTKNLGDLSKNSPFFLSLPHYKNTDTLKNLV